MFVCICELFMFHLNSTSVFKEIETKTNLSPHIMHRPSPKQNARYRLMKHNSNQQHMNYYELFHQILVKESLPLAGRMLTCRDI